MRAQPELYHGGIEKMRGPGALSVAKLCGSARLAKRSAIAFRHRLRTLSPTQFTVDVGSQSRIEVYRNPITGRLRILADGNVVTEQGPFSPFTQFSLTTLHRYAFTVMASWFMSSERLRISRPIAMRLLPSDLRGHSEE